MSRLFSLQIIVASTTAAVVLAAGAGCKTADYGYTHARPVEFISRNPSDNAVERRHLSYYDTFRAFHQTSFPNGSWVVEEGMLRSVKGAGVDLITTSTYRDFEFFLEWKVTPGANSGIMYGVTEETSDTYWSGPEYQINDDPRHDDGKVPTTSAGALYDLLAPDAAKHLKPIGDWNQARIVSRGGHIEHWLNGARIVAYDWNSPALRDLIKKSKFANQPHFMKELNGHIALQHHGDEVWFRDLRITRY